MNGDTSYEFKSLFHIAKVALQMDIDNEEAHDIQDEEFYFDGICSRYKVSRLFSLSCHQEQNSSLCNYGHERQEGHNFNPKAIMVDTN